MPKSPTKTTEAKKPNGKKLKEPPISSSVDKSGSNVEGSKPEPKSLPSNKTPSTTGKKVTKAKSVERPIVYPEIKMLLCQGEKALTAEKAKKLLGWEEESENIKFGSDYILTDENGKKIRCFNNSKNRPYDPTTAQCWKAEILQGHWKLNGETLIIGKTGAIISAQHRLVALVLAAQAWAKQPDKWDAWSKEPTLDCLIVQGIAEDDATVNTVDTAKPRSLADVIYRSEIFAGYKSAIRKIVAKRLDKAVNMLWHRTGAKENAFSPRRTHADSLDFINRHPKLLECVKHIYEEDSERKISAFLSPGYAAALLYLQGSCLTITETEAKDGYFEVAAPNETQLNWELWDKACEFWVLIASDHAKIKPLKDALANILDTIGNATVWERIALLVLCWNNYAQGETATLDDLALKYEFKDDRKVLSEHPVVGGIDIGGELNATKSDAS